MGVYDVITPFKCGDDRFRGLWLAEGQSLPFCYHRLNGSSSHVLTATSLSYGKAKNSTTTESKPLIWLR